MIQIKNKIIRPNACIEEQDLRDLEQEYVAPDFLSFLNNMVEE